MRSQKAHSLVKAAQQFRYCCAAYAQPASAFLGRILLYPSYKPFFVRFLFDQLFKIFDVNVFFYAQLCSARAAASPSIWWPLQQKGHALNCFWLFLIVSRVKPSSGNKKRVQPKEGFSLKKDRAEFLLRRGIRSMRSLLFFFFAARVPSTPSCKGHAHRKQKKDRAVKKGRAVCAFFILCVPKLRILLFKIFDTALLTPSSPFYEQDIIKAHTRTNYRSILFFKIKDFNKPSHF